MAPKVSILTNFMLSQDLLKSFGDSVDSYTSFYQHIPTRRPENVLSSPPWHLQIPSRPLPEADSTRPHRRRTNSPGTSERDNSPSAHGRKLLAPQTPASWTGLWNPPRLNKLGVSLIIQTDIVGHKVMTKGVSFVELRRTIGFIQNWMTMVFDQ